MLTRENWLVDSYGQTENCAGAVRCLPGDLEPAGTVGPPNAGVEIKLIDVPDVSTALPVRHRRAELTTRRRWSTLSPTSLTLVVKL